MKNTMRFDLIFGLFCWNLLNFVEGNSYLFDEISMYKFLIFLGQVISEQLDEENEVTNSKTFTKKLPVKIGPDGRPFLFGPKIDLCKSRELFFMYPISLGSKSNKQPQ